MYCPLCGKEMNEVKREIKKPSEPDWCNQKEVDEYCRAEENKDESEWYYCPENRCFGEDYPLVCHHAPGFPNDEGNNLMHTAPGDSWSLTWLK